PPPSRLQCVQGRGTPRAATGVRVIKARTRVSQDVAEEMRGPATTAQSVVRPGLTIATPRGILAHVEPLLADRCVRDRGRRLSRLSRLFSDIVIVTRTSGDVGRWSGRIPPGSPAKPIGHGRKGNERH